MLDKFLHHQVQVVIVGSAIPPRSPVADLAQQHPGRLAFINTYDDRLPIWWKRVPTSS